MAEDEEGQRSERAPKIRLSAERRDRFLEVLGQTGNRRAAALAIGVEPRLMDQRRQFDKVLDRQWEAALDQADRRLAGAAGPLDCIGGREFNVIRRGRNGRLMIVASGGKRWNKQVDDRFFAALASCGNISAAVRSVGFSLSCVAQRRRQWPDFARRLEEALEDAELAIEFRLACGGSDVAVMGLEGGGTGSETPSPDPSRSGGRGDFDPDLAMRFLKWREEKRRGGGRRGRVPAAPSIEEVTERIIRKVEAIKRHRARDGGGADELP